MNQLPNNDYRVGDAERTQAINDLGSHFSAGRLDAQEFDARLNAATSAVMKSDLAQLFVDLPPLTQSPSFQLSTIPTDKSKLPLYIGLGIGAFLLLVLLMRAPVLLFLIWLGIMFFVIKYASKPPNQQNNHPHQQ
ncbi:MAG: DUF1707 domain-containing protein [Corynebacterium sp.]|nr:DUF1707 domain-containing protein [Corynebacterium sp.]